MATVTESRYLHPAGRKEAKRAEWEVRINEPDGSSWSRWFGHLDDFNGGGWADPEAEARDFADGQSHRLRLTEINTFPTGTRAWIIIRHVVAERWF